MRKRKSSPPRSKNSSSDPIRVVVTAGPTRAFIDPVRYISNLSTGRMGYEIARQAATRKNFRVTLISGPAALRTPPRVRLIPIVTSNELEKAVMKEIKAADILIMTAAVNDYVPVRVMKRKLRRKQNSVTLKLRRANDIVARVARLSTKPVVVGFSLETENVTAYTRAKLKRKNLDLMVGNQYSRRENPFGNRKPSVLIVDRSGESIRLPKQSKERIARHVLSKALAFLRK
ncbi:MAG: hypothetical protein HY587_06050 [Candidatus Omnitrophica bacterium]|nr:hypothetical protein [Candidatus Omnitrophota bacterium]